MKTGITQRKYEAEVLFSILADSSNVLFRDRLAAPTVSADAHLEWRNDFIWGWLPVANEEMPLASVPLRVEVADGRHRARLEPPRHLVEALSTRFLREMLGAMRAAGMEPTPPWDDDDVDGGIRDVSARVAEMWAWISF